MDFYYNNYYEVIRMVSKKNIVILGAGYGGVHAAKLLSKKYKKDARIKKRPIPK